MNPEDGRYSDPDYDRDGTLIGEEQPEHGYNADEDENWGKRGGE